MSAFQEGFQNALGPYQMAKQGIDEGTARRKQAGLGGLMADYAAGGQPDYQGIAANGGNPLAVRQDADNQKQGRLKELGQFAGYLASIKDPVARNRAYTTIRPKLDAIGQEFQLGPLPDMLDDSHMDELQALHQQFGGGADNRAPSNVQSFDTFSRYAGYAPGSPEHQAAARVALYQDPRAKVELAYGPNGANEVTMGGGRPPTAAPIMEGGPQGGRQAHPGPRIQRRHPRRLFRRERQRPGRHAQRHPRS